MKRSYVIFVMHIAIVFAFISTSWAGDVTPGLPMDIFAVLDEMAEAVQL